MEVNSCPEHNWEPTDDTIQSVKCIGCNWEIKTAHLSVSDRITLLFKLVGQLRAADKSIHNRISDSITYDTPGR